jgi:hypothetical protein
MDNWHRAAIAVADHGVVRLRTGEAVLEFQGTTDVRRSLVSYGTNLPGLNPNCC